MPVMQTLVVSDRNHEYLVLFCSIGNCLVLELLIIRISSVVYFQKKPKSRIANLPNAQCTYQPVEPGYEFVPQQKSYDNMPSNAKGMMSYDNVATSHLQYDNAPPDHRHWTHECPKDDQCGHGASGSGPTSLGASGASGTSLETAGTSGVSLGTRGVSESEPRRSPMFDSGIGINGSHLGTPDQGSKMKIYDQAGSGRMMTLKDFAGRTPSPECLCDTGAQRHKKASQTPEGSYDNVPKGAAVYSQLEHRGNVHKSGSGYDNVKDFRSPVIDEEPPPVFPRNSSKSSNRKTFIITDPELNVSRPEIEDGSPVANRSKMNRSEQLEGATFDFVRAGFSQVLSLPATPRIVTDDPMAASSSGDSPGGGLPISFDDGFDAALAALSSLDISASREMSRSAELRSSALVYPAGARLVPADTRRHKSATARVPEPRTAMTPTESSDSISSLTLPAQTASIAARHLLREQPGRGRAPLATPESIHLGGSDADVRSTLDRKRGSKISDKESPDTPTPDFSPPSAWDSESRIFQQIQAANSPALLENKVRT